MKHERYAFTHGMSTDEVEERLRTSASGVLALADEGDAYAIPVDHYYDSDRLYFRLGISPGSTKGRYWDETRTAAYVLHGTTPTDAPRELDSWSVIITGRLRELPGDEHDRFDVPEINRRFAPIRIFGESIEDVDIVVAELEIEEATGRKTVRS